METKRRMSKEEKVPVTITVDLFDQAINAKSIYLTGNIDELGFWDPNKAVRLKKSGNKYQAILEVNPDYPIEFKVLNQKDWLGVEKGKYNEEVSNHCFYPGQSNNYMVEVSNWNYF